MAFMPRPIIVLLCTKTQPTGVSFVERASSAIARASRMKFRWVCLSSSVMIEVDLEGGGGGEDDILLEAFV